VIALFVPGEIVTELLERLVEGDPVTVSLGIDDNTVHVEKKRFYISHILS
jgi:hypothetical protein